MLRLGHLNIEVVDLERSKAFYARWFGFGAVLAEYADGTTFVTDGNGFELALHHDPGATAVPTWHFGFLAETGDEVRELLSSMRAAGVVVGDAEDVAAYCGFKCHDPDGHVIEVYFEPR